MPRRSTLAAFGALLLAGCMSRPEGAEILIATTPPGASCALSRLGQQIATAQPTPAIALVEPGSGDIVVLCRRHGFADAAVTLPAVPRRSGFFSSSSRHESRVDIALAPEPR